jgi:flagellar hook-length control protein FliK
MHPRLDTAPPPAVVPGLRHGAPLPPTALGPDASGPSFAQALASRREPRSPSPAAGDTPAAAGRATAPAPRPEAPRADAPGRRERDAEPPAEGPAADDAAEGADRVTEQAAERRTDTDDARAAADLAALLAGLSSIANPTSDPATGPAWTDPSQPTAGLATDPLPVGGTEDARAAAAAPPSLEALGTGTGADVAAEANSLAHPGHAGSARLLAAGGPTDPGAAAASPTGTDAASAWGPPSGRSGLPGSERPSALESSAPPSAAPDAARAGSDTTTPLGETGSAANGTAAPLAPALAPSSGAEPGAAATAASGLAATPAPLGGTPAPGGAEAPVLHGRVTAHPASPQFVPQLAAQLEMFVREGVQNARLQLHPAELGPVAVQIQLEGGQAQVALAAEVASTRERLLEALPQLARQLEQGGLGWAGGSVGSQLADGRRAPGDDPPPGRQDPGGNGTAGAVGGEPGPVVPAPRRSRGIVDLVA